MLTELTWIYNEHEDKYHYTDSNFNIGVTTLVSMKPRPDTKDNIIAIFKSGSDLWEAALNTADNIFQVSCNRRTVHNKFNYDYPHGYDTKLEISIIPTYCNTGDYVHINIMDNYKSILAFEIPCNNFAMFAATFYGEIESSKTWTPLADFQHYDEREEEKQYINPSGKRIVVRE